MPDARRLDDERVRRLVERAAADVEAGTLPSCQVALARDGEVLVEAAFGDAETTDRYVLFSVTKALTAASVWLAIGDGLLSADMHVAELVPAFTTGGREAVTVEHLLTHTAGFPNAPMRLTQGADPEQRNARFATWRLDWEPGSRMTYHPTSAHWVLADLVERVRGIDHREAALERVLAPLGLTRMRLGGDGSRGDDVRTLVHVEAKGPDGVTVPDDARFPPAELLQYNEPSNREAGSPGGGAVSTARDVALLYQAFLRNPGGLFDPEVLADGTARVRCTLIDPWFGVPCNRTLGLTLAGDDGNAVLRQLGRATGPRAFGAPGVGGQIGWADPDSGLSFCYLTNGLTSDPSVSFLRAAELSTLAAKTVIPVS
ncbi:MAG TPA: serine hydrolase domain-containing protein [Mycobacteriales bacterium]|nr:serine hydrolase domain-containing protein [Mycobacteriales bacterium]